MGCDIHAFTEYKQGGRWRFKEELDINRDYEIFANLASVRNYGDQIKPISMPRGLPDDPSQAVADFAEEWEGNGHSHSFLKWSEINSHDWRGYEGNDRSDAKKEFQELEWMAQEKEDELCRVVFWFDN